jgi:hypothetical protein
VQLFFEPLDRLLAKMNGTISDVPKLHGSLLKCFGYWLTRFLLFCTAFTSNLFWTFDTGRNASTNCLGTPNHLLPIDRVAGPLQVTLPSFTHAMRQRRHGCGLRGGSFGEPGGKQGSSWGVGTPWPKDLCAALVAYLGGEECGPCPLALLMLPSPCCV